ncbi:MAG: hypothetical protein GEU73_04040 [Chloroflexi bacterium]|nr:hypothetical protein [Chloroflexota bacterium]
MREGPRVGLYDEILIESGIMVADLRVAVIDELWYGMLRAASAVRKFCRLVAAFARPPVSVETSRPTAVSARLTHHEEAILTIHGPKLRKGS